MASSVTLDNTLKRQAMAREQARKGFKEEALAAWAAFRETDQHLTVDEVRDWLNKWGGQDETELPQCHG